MYKYWLHNQFKAIYKLYDHWYDEDNHGKYLDNSDEYEQQYYITHLMINDDCSISASYMEKCDSFYGHSVHIDIGSRAKIHKYSI